MKALSIVMMSALLAGCQSLGGAPPPTRSRADTLASVASKTSLTVIDQYDAEKDSEQRRLRRNMFVNARIVEINANYDAFARAISVEQRSVTIGSQILVLGLAGGAAVAKSAATKTRLATWSAGILGTQSLVDKELYFNKTLPALKAQMEASRQTAIAKLRVGMSKPDAEYSLDSAQSDLRDLEVAGTVDGALGAITSEAGKQNAQATEVIARITTARFSYDDASDTIRRFWKPDGSINKENEKKLKDWLAANAEGMPITFFISSASAQDKAELVKALNIK